MVEKIIYIASPYRGEVELNTERARRYCRFAVSEGCMPIAPHLLYPQFMDDDNREERKKGLSFAVMLLDKCDELWVMGENISDGMLAEMEHAKDSGIPIRYFNAKCEEVSNKCES